MKTFQPADHLHSRTFLGLLVAQFFAAFNDQAIHASAMFFAMNTDTLTESSAISLMPVLFYAPWAIFCTVAGYLADKYSKRNALVLWKVVEVGITLVALFGFWLGRQGGLGAAGTWIVLACVFLMGMHSAFFVPAKYGVMPEILTPRRLSRGNGVLESLSFLAVILGTVFGGYLSTEFRDREYLIGLILVALAVVGAVASLFIQRMPAANPTRPFPEFVYKPLYQSIRTLLSSRPLVFAVVGIAFFTFLVAYVRQVVYMHGQSQQPPWSEAYTSIIVGMVALGIGIGSPLAGYLSGGKVEVGLVPLGALGMMLATTVAAFTLAEVPILVACIVLIGFFTGFYLVPLFSLLQHRAPKASKGDSIATSNFINITGAILASVVFFSLHAAAVRSGFSPALDPKEEFRGRLESEPKREHGHVVKVEVGGRPFEATPEPDLLTQFRDSFGGRQETGGKHRRIRLDSDVEVGKDVVVRTYVLNDVVYYSVQPTQEEPNPIYNKEKLPELLFLGTGATTLLTLLLLWYFLPDLLRRSWLWLRGLGSYRLELAGMLRLPGSGPVILVIDAKDREALAHVERAADRQFHLANTAEQARAILAKGQVLALTAPLGEALPPDTKAPILPIHHSEMTRFGKRYVYVVAGNLLPAGAPAETIREELRRVSEETARRVGGGQPLETEAAH